MQHRRQFKLLEMRLQAFVPQMQSPSQRGLADKEKPNKTGQKRKIKAVARGVDEPLPKLRRIEGNAIADSSSKRNYYQVALPQGSKLALRFPHLVKQVEEP